MKTKKLNLSVKKASSKPSLGGKTPKTGKIPTMKKGGTKTKAC